jgi:transposase-like protein
MGKFTREKIIPVPCPYCSNTRLFDCKKSSEGIIEIKCPQCKRVSTIDLQYVNQRRKEILAYQKNNYEIHNSN